MDGQAMLEIERPRSIFKLLGATATVYRRNPWLFSALAGVVFVPYELINLVPHFLPGGGLQAIIYFLLTIADIALVLPLISAFHVIAIDGLNGRRAPRFATVSRRGIGRLRVVSAATVMSWLGIFVGFVLLVVPGVILWARWSVAAQTAALEDHNWSGAIERSTYLAKGHYLHVIGFLVLVFVVLAIPTAVIDLFFGFHFKPVAFLIRLPFGVLTSSFSALATALLYFDLKSRRRPLDPASNGDEEPPTVQPTGHPLDPDRYNDGDRLPGWYVMPDAPWKMRYWGGIGDGGGWSNRTAKTPKSTQDGWYKARDR